VVILCLLSCAYFDSYITKQSGRSEWCKRGNEFAAQANSLTDDDDAKRGLLLHAAQCYEKSSQTAKVRTVNAQIAILDAKKSIQSIPSKNKLHQHSQVLRKAIDTCLPAGMLIEMAEVLLELNMTELAGNLYAVYAKMVHDTTQHKSKAAECFVKAAQCKEQSNDIVGAVECYQLGGQCSQAIGLLVQNGMHVNAVTLY
jgi:hypothetical protein